MQNSEIVEKPYTLVVADEDDADFGTGDPSVPVEKWGKDHWSTFAFIETLNVDQGQGVGVIDDRKRANMRTHADLHPGLLHWQTGDGSAYPTRLKAGETVEHHDDWSCVEDFVAMGLARWEGTGIRPAIVLTDEGWRIAEMLRRHKGTGGNFAGFEPGEITLPTR